MAHSLTAEQEKTFVDETPQGPKTYTVTVTEGAIRIGFSTDGGTTWKRRTRPTPNKNKVFQVTVQGGVHIIIKVKAKPSAKFEINSD
jgi:hypothetical protein